MLREMLGAEFGGVIDFHCHIRGRLPAPSAGDLDATLALASRAGIGRLVLAGGYEGLTEDPAAPPELVTRVNDFSLAVARMRPECPDPTVPESSRPPRPQPAASRYWTAYRIAGWSLVAAGTTASTAAVYFGWSVEHQEGKLEALGRDWTADRQQDLEASARRDQALALGIGVAAVGMVASGIALLVTRPPRPTRSTPTPGTAWTRMRPSSTGGSATASTPRSAFPPIRRSCAHHKGCCWSPRCARTRSAAAP